MKLKTRAAIDVLSVTELSKSRLGRVKNGDVVLIPPYMLKNLYALRHVEVINRLDGVNVMSDGMLKAKYWRKNIFDPGSYNKLFDKIDNFEQKHPNELGIVAAICA